MLFYIFLMLFPFVFFPDVGISKPTPFGTLTPSDYVLPVLYLLLAPCIFRRSQGLLPKRMAALYSFFIIWTLISTLLIRFKYPTLMNAREVTIFGLLKLGKFFEYSFFGYLLVRSLYTTRRIVLFLMSFAAGCLFLSLSLLYTVTTSWDPGEDSVSKALFMYKANLISVTLAILICFWTAFFLKKTIPLSWNIILIFLGLMIAAMIATQGRGGWVAAMFGFAFIMFKRKFELRRINWKKLSIAFVAVIVFSFLFNHYAAVRRRTLTIIRPNLYAADSTSQIVLRYGLSDGNRFDIFIDSFDKLGNNPFLGAGFFNRNPQSELYWSGSHNFFLQMALETGLVGFIALAYIFYILWNSTHKKIAAKHLSGVNFDAFKASLLAIIVGCMSGEYLYGGAALLAFSCIVAIYFSELNCYTDVNYGYRAVQLRNANGLILTGDKEFALFSKID